MMDKKNTIIIADVVLTDFVILVINPTPPI